MRHRISLLLCLAALLSAQSRRASYQQAFQTWRQTDASLETDAATAGAALTPRANKVATLAAEYGAERIGYLRAASDDATQRVLGVQATVVRPIPDLAPVGEQQQIVSTESQVVSTTMASFANDSNRGIQQLRQALERERASLTALSSAIADRQKAQAKTAQASALLDRARGKAGEDYGKLSFALAQYAAQVDKETSAWASYYQKLAAAAAGAPEKPAVTSNTGPTSTTGPARANTPTVSLARFVGGWTFPPAGGQFHGAQPEFVDLVVHEERGRVNGTLYGRFKLPAGSPGDPVLRFDFEGEWQAAPIQSFTLLTGDGAKGSIDLIPGPAFNLLEVNFQTDPKPNKVRMGNFILVKK